MRVLLVDPIPTVAPERGTATPSHAIASLGRWFKEQGNEVTALSFAGVKSRKKALKILKEKSNVDLVAFSIVDHTAKTTIWLANRLGHPNTVIGGHTITGDREGVRKLTSPHIKLASTFREAFSVDDESVINRMGDSNIYDEAATGVPVVKKTVFFVTCQS